jgi:hypothetical protein
MQGLRYLNTGTGGKIKIESLVSRLATTATVQRIRRMLLVLRLENNKNDRIKVSD